MLFCIYHTMMCFLLQSYEYFVKIKKVLLKNLIKLRNMVLNVIKKKSYL